MNDFLKAAAGVLIAMILFLVLSRRDKDFAGLMSLGVCCMVILGAVTYLEPLVSFIRQLKSLGNINSELLEILLKTVGISLLAQLIELICTDAGNAALGKAIQIFASAVILWLALPLMNSLLELIGKVIGNV